MSDLEDSVWIFHGAKAQFASAVFSSVTVAEEWIAKTKVSGILTEYSLNESAYDWAMGKSFFEPKTDKESSPEFIQRFSSASQIHFHYEDGKKD